MKSPLYTMTGDHGRTSLVGGTRVSKSDPRIEAYGTVDELNSQIAMLAVGCKEPYPDIYDVLLMIQNKLFNIGAYLATEDAKAALGIEDEDVEAIEKIIDILYEKLPKTHRFVLPGGTKLSAQAEICRTVARRAERRIILLADNKPVNPDVMRFVNRISDLFFVIGRYNNITTGTKEIFWEK